MSGLYVKCVLTLPTVKKKKKSIFGFKQVFSHFQKNAMVESLVGLFCKQVHPFSRGTVDPRTNNNVHHLEAQPQHGMQMEPRRVAFFTAFVRMHKLSFQHCLFERVDHIDIKVSPGQ